VLFRLEELQESLPYFLRSHIFIQMFLADV